MSTRIGNRRWISATASPWSKPLRIQTNPMETSPNTVSYRRALQEERCSNPVGARHCNIRGNELADLEAKLGSEVAQTSVPLDSSTRAALIRRKKAVVAHPLSLDCFIHDPTPRRRRGRPPRSRPNRPHPFPLRTPSPPPTLATYDRNVGDGQLPTLRGGRRVV